MMRFFVLSFSLFALNHFGSPVPESRPKVLHLVQINPLASEAYMLSQQETATLDAVDVAIGEARALYPECVFELQRTFGVGTEEDLFQTIKNIASLPGDHVVFGVSRSTSARVAARASSGTSLVQISIAAGTDDLRRLNPYTLSVSAPSAKQWESITGKLKELNCEASKTLGVFSSGDSLSQIFRRLYLESGFTEVLELDELLSGPETVKRALDMQCIVLGTSLPAAIEPLTRLHEHRWAGYALGTGDWTFFAPEMRQYLARTPGRSLRLFAPSTWEIGENEKSSRWVRRHFNDRNVEPLHIYTHDATMLALAHLCRQADVLVYNSTWENFGLLRDYLTVLPSGNLDPNFHLVEIR